MGPAIATQIILDSKLREEYDLVHVDTNVHKSIQTMGKWSVKKIWQNIAIYLRFLSVIWKEKPDLIIIPISQSTLGFLKDAFFILLSGRLNLSRRTIIQLRGSNIKNWLAASSWMTQRFVSFTIRSADGVIVLGEKLKYLFADYFPKEQIYVVPNGANYPLTSKRRPQGQTQGQTQGQNPVRILYLANLQPSKGIEDFVEAVHGLSKRYNNQIVVDVVGQWRDEATRLRCLDMLKQSSLPITFHGKAVGKDKYRFLEHADLFVFVPRAPEGHPWVIVEAMAAGLPIVSTDQGAITESVLHGINGFIVQPNNPRQLAEHIEKLILSPELRSKFSSASKAHYLDQFTEEKMVKKLSTVFDTVINGQLSPA